MPLVTNSSDTAPFGKTHPGLRRNTPLFVPAKRKKGRSFYDVQASRYRPRQVDPYQFPGGGLGDVGYTADDGIEGLGDTGIPAVDAILADANRKIDRLVRAVEIGTIASVAGALFGLALLVGGPRR